MVPGDSEEQQQIKEEGGSLDRSRSGSREREREHSGSPQKDEEMRSRSASPAVQNDVDE